MARMGQRPPAASRRPPLQAACRQACHGHGGCLGRLGAFVGTRAKVLNRQGLASKLV